MIASKKKRIDIEQQIPKDIYSNTIKSLKSKKLFLTGGTGFFGKSFLKVLVALNVIEKLNLGLCVLSRNPETFRKSYP